MNRDGDRVVEPLADDVQARIEDIWQVMAKVRPKGPRRRNGDSYLSDREIAAFFMVEGFGGLWDAGEDAAAPAHDYDGGDRYYLAALKHRSYTGIGRSFHRILVPAWHAVRVRAQEEYAAEREKRKAAKRKRDRVNAIKRRAAKAPVKPIALLPPKREPSELERELTGLPVANLFRRCGI